jgi:NitT/TauT family transport system permease protein
MSSASLTQSHLGFANPAGRRAPVWISGLTAAAAWAAATAVTAGLPDIDDFERTGMMARLTGGIAAVLFLLVAASRVLPSSSPWLNRIRPAGPWLTALPLALLAWEGFWRATPSVPPAASSPVFPSGGPAPSATGHTRS